MKQKNNGVKQFISKIDRNVLNCPLGVTDVNDYIKKLNLNLKKVKSLSKSEQNFLKLHTEGTCELYKNISTSSLVNVGNVCRDIKVAINYITTKINTSTKPSLLLMGEKHRETHSFLMQISVLNFLKKSKLAKKMLIEFDSTGVWHYKNTHLSSFLSLDARNFAYSVLNYDLVGIDNYHGYSNKISTMSVREESMLKEINRAAEESVDKVIVASVGYAHLSSLKVLEDSKKFNPIILNMAPSSALERKLSSIHIFESTDKVQERYNTIDLIQYFGFNEDLHSMTMMQILDIFQFCEKEGTLDDQYWLSKGIEGCAMINVNDYIACEDFALNNDL